MKIDLPKEEIPAEAIAPHYKLLIDMHMHYEKMQLKTDFSYTKYAGFFILAFIAFIVMQGRGIASNYLINVIFTGFGVLFASAMSMIFVSSEIDRKRANIEQEGKWMEEKYPSVRFSYFKAPTFVKAPRYKAGVFSRLFPFVFVGLCTIATGIAFSAKISSNIATLVGALSTALLIAATFFLARIMKKWQICFEETVNDHFS